jgi:beta-lactamase class D
MKEFEKEHVWDDFVGYVKRQAQAYTPKMFTTTVDLDRFTEEKKNQFFKLVEIGSEH